MLRMIGRVERAPVDLHLLAQIGAEHADEDRPALLRRPDDARLAGRNANERRDAAWSTAPA